MKSTPLAYLALTLTAIFFAGNTIVGRAVNEDLPPMGLAFWRAFGAFVLIAPFGARQIWAERVAVIASWRILSLMGVLGVGAFSGLVFVGLQYTEALNASLIQGTMPLNIIIAAFVVLGQTISPRQCIGLVAGAIGFATIVMRGDVSNIEGFGLNLGDAMIWLGVFCHGLFSILLPRRPQALRLTGFMTVTFFVGSVAILPFHIWEIAEGRGMPANWTALWAAGYVAIFPSLLAQIFWTAAIGRVGAQTAGYFIYLTPVFGAVAAITLLGEAPGWYHATGVAFIFAGIWLATTGSRKPAAS